MVYKFYYFYGCAFVNQTTDEQKMEMLDKVLITERIILQTLAFDLRIVHPIEKLYEKWKSILKYLNAENKLFVKKSAIRFLTGMNFTHNTNSHFCVQIYIFLIIPFT